MRHTYQTRLKISNSKLIENPSYSAIHKWIVKWYGKANGCTKCGDTSIRTYEWANISGQYLRDIRDFMSLCVPCHRRLDGNDKLYLYSSVYQKRRL